MDLLELKDICWFQAVWNLLSQWYLLQSLYAITAPFLQETDFTLGSTEKYWGLAGLLMMQHIIWTIWNLLNQMLFNGTVITHLMYTLNSIQISQSGCCREVQFSWEGSPQTHNIHLHEGNSVFGHAEVRTACQRSIVLSIGKAVYPFRRRDSSPRTDNAHNISGKLLNLTCWWLSESLRSYNIMYAWYVLYGIPYNLGVLFPDFIGS